MGNLKSYARLTFKTSTGNFLIVDDSNDDILSVTTHKELTNPNGTFSIMLGPRIAKALSIERGSLLVSNLISIYDLVQIEFKVDDSGYHTEMIGMVSRASVVLNIGAKGAPQRAVKIDGFDMGMVVKNFKLYFSPFLAGKDFQEYGGQIVFGQDNDIFAGKNPAEFVKAFINYAVGEPFEKGPAQVFYPLTLPNGLKITNYVDFQNGLSTSFEQNIILDPLILTNIQPNVEISVYDLVKFYSDIPYHEVFVDLRRPSPTNGMVTQADVDAAEQTHKLQPLSNNLEDPTSNNLQPYVFTMRTTPFSQGAGGWDGLNAHDFLTSDVVAQDIATSESNVYNYYDVVCERQSFALGDKQLAYVSELGKSTNANGELIHRFPIQDQDSIDRFGIKRFPYHTTKYVEFVSSATAVKAVNKKYADNILPIKRIRSLARQLFRWFSFGEMFETGMISLKGRVGVGPNGITMGSRLREKKPDGTLTGKEFYIESVMQEFNLGAPLKTSASVTRGHYPYDWTDSVGAHHLGRFSIVKQTEENLFLDQANNAQFFIPIDAEDGVK